MKNYNFEAIGKFSLKNTRHIGQAGLLLPLYSNSNFLLYTPAFFMMDNKYSNEINVGIGFRQLLMSKYIHGVYAFFDYRKSPQKHFFKQITLGYEFFSNNFEIRANLYLPEKKSINRYIPVKDTVKKTQYDGHYTTFEIDRTNNLYSEQASKGFDLEFGLTKGVSSAIHLAYYGFFNQGNQTHGLRLRGNLRIFSWLSLESEVSCDTDRKFIPYAGIKLNYPLIKKRHHNSIYAKINYLPVRDVDIRTDVKFYKNAHTNIVKRITGWVPYIDKSNTVANKSNTYKNMAELNSKIKSGKKYNDISIISTFNHLFSLMGKFDGRTRLLVPGMVEYDILTNMKEEHVYYRLELYYVQQSGFWTYEKELLEHLAILNELKKKIKLDFSATFDATGIFPYIFREALKWEFRNRSDVFVAKFDGCIGPANKTKKTEAENIADLAKALTHKNHTSKTRYILINLHQKRHAVGVVIDKVDKKIIYMNSHDLDHTWPWKGSAFDYVTNKFVGYNKPVLDTQFPGYTYINYTPVIQDEDWSCSAHAYMNVVGYIKNTFSINQTHYRRNVRSVRERMLYSQYAYSRWLM